MGKTDHRPSHAVFHEDLTTCSAYGQSVTGRLGSEAAQGLKITLSEKPVNGVRLGRLPFERRHRSFSHYAGIAHGRVGGYVVIGKHAKYLGNGPGRGGDAERSRRSGRRPRPSLPVCPFCIFSTAFAPRTKDKQQAYAAELLHIDSPAPKIPLGQMPWFCLTASTNPILIWKRWKWGPTFSSAPPGTPPSLALDCDSL
jgi:hypothetical protein